MHREPCQVRSLTREAGGPSIIAFPFVRQLDPETRNPELDRDLQVRKYGLLLGWMMVWLGRSRIRRELMDVALRQPDSVLEDAGMTRRAALQEAEKWFWAPLAER